MDTNETDNSVDSANRSMETKNTSSRQFSLKSVVIIVLICTIVSSLITAGGVASTLLITKNLQNHSKDSTRKSIVQEGEVIADIAQNVGPSVVSIVTEQTSQIDSLYFGSRTSKSQAAGTGLIIDSNGLILTNKHVVPESTQNVTVVTSDGVSYENAEIVGRDPLNDLAIIKVKSPKNFKSVVFGNSDDVRTGQKVIAIGNALGQFQNTVTSGIISGMGRPVEAGDEAGNVTEQLSNLFQTDAAINSGNSGGPLLNYSGEVIGINTAVAANAENIGFSIPINEAKGLIDSVKTTGKISRPLLGVKFITLTPAVAKELNITTEKGAYVDKEAGSVVAGSPAEKAGIKPGDIITKLGDITLNEKIPLSSAVGRYKAGDTVEVTILRGGKEQKLSATLSEAPAN